jgi:DNA-binding NtrC family response regulator
MTEPLRILVADDEKAARYGLAKALARDGYHLLEAADIAATREALRGGLPDLVFLDLRMPDGDGRDILRELSARPSCEIVVLTAQDDLGTAVECMRLGATDYLTKPYELEHVRAIARRAARRVELEREVGDLRDQLDRKQACGALVGGSRPMLDLYRQMERVAAAPVDVLVRGETGTGKELVARELHRLSGRTGPFVAVNTAAIAESLAESALFGHVKGAFTGADSNRPGAFEQADGGTLFLDEIGDMPLAAQTKILRVLQERVVQPVGGSRTIAVNVRVVSATHQDLTRAIADGHFRQDLYYRIKGVELFVPPLRSRPEDIVPLANHFLERLPQALPLAREAIARLVTHPWPGNVRELEHVVVGASTLAAGADITVADLRLPTAAMPSGGLDFGPFLELPLTEAKDRLIESFERTAIRAALDRHAGNVSAAARQLGIHRQSLQQKMTQLGLSRG